MSVRSCAFPDRIEITSAAYTTEVLPLSFSCWMRVSSSVGMNLRWAYAWRMCGGSNGSRADRGRRAGRAAAAAARRVTERLDAALRHRLILRGLALVGLGLELPVGAKEGDGARRLLERLRGMGEREVEGEGKVEGEVVDMRARLLDGAALDAAQ